MKYINQDCHYIFCGLDGTDFWVLSNQLKFINSFTNLQENAL